MFKQYQEVKLKLERLNDTFFGKSVELRRGQKGIIVEIHRRPGIPIGYDVEFFDKNGQTVAVTIVGENDIEVMPAKHKAKKSAQGVA